MNILIVSENFTGGGLETHIHSYYMELRQSHHFVFAFGRFKSNLEFDPADIHTGFHFSWDQSIQDFIDDVEQLALLIREEKIHVVHAHPFYSIFPAVMAGQLTGVPVVCTHHGTASFTFPGGLTEAALLYYAYLELVSCVISVSQSGKLALEQRVHVPDVVFMPNAIDSRLYRRHTVVKNRRWAVVSRLDADVGTVAALKKFFEILPSLPIDAVDVYGDGSQRWALEEYVRNLGLDDRVRFAGFQSDLYARLDGKYNGIIGSGRVALEGLTMGYPVLELGYGRICGLLCGDMLTRAMEINFVANTLPCYDTESITAQLEQAHEHPEQFDFRQEMLDAFDIRAVASAYIEKLSSLDARSCGDAAAWFESVKALPVRDGVRFYVSPEIFQTMIQKIKPCVIDQTIQNMFLTGIIRTEHQLQIGQLQSSAAAQSGYLEQIKSQFSQQFQAQSEQIQSLSEQIWAQSEQIRSLSAQLQAQSEQIQVQAEQIKTQSEQLRDQSEQMQVYSKQIHARIKDLSENQALQAERIRAEMERHMTLLQQQGKQIDYHKKILAPLIWTRKSLSRIIGKIKGLLRIIQQGGQNDK